jgi:RNA polymerase sigma factor (sigma-70 family)
MPDQNIKRVLDGDKDAFRFIIRQFQDSAFTLAVSITKEEFAAKDAVQAAFVKAYTRLHTFERKSSFKTWFHRIVVNEAFQVLRNQKRRQKLSFALKADEEGTSNPVNYIEHSNTMYPPANRHSSCCSHEKVSLKDWTVILIGRIKKVWFWFWVRAIR